METLALIISILYSVFKILLLILSISIIVVFLIAVFEAQIEAKKNIDKKDEE